MARSFVGNTNASAGQGSTHYASLGGLQQPGSETTEARAQLAFPAGTFRNLSFTVTARLDANDTVTARLRKNGANGNLVASSPAGATGRFEDTTHEDTVADGDLVNLSFTGSGAPFSATLSAAVVEFDTGDGNPPVTFFGSGSQSATSNTGDLYGRFGAVAQLTSNGLGLRHELRAAGTLSHFRVFVTSNSKTVGATITLRKNDADTALVLSIPSATTGAFEDTSHTVHVDSGDDIHYRFNGGGSGTGSLAYRFLTVRFTGDSAAFDTLAGFPSASSNITNVPVYARVWGSLAPDTSEANSQFRVPFPCTAKNLRCYVSSGGIAGGGTTMRSRVNGANGNQVVSAITASGWFEDTTNTDSLSAGDLFTVEFAATSVSSAGGVDMLACTFQGAGATPPVEVDGGLGTLELTGLAAGVAAGVEVAAGLGTLEFTGYAADVRLIISVEAGDPAGLLFTGYEGAVAAGANVTAGDPGALELVGLKGYLNPVFASQAAALALGGGEPEARGSQVAVMALGSVRPDASASAAAVLALGVVVPDVPASQAVVLVLAEEVPCVTRWSQCWLFKRLDGEEFCFTAHDRPVEFMGRTFEPCSSLMPTAVEAATDLGAVGNMELSGIIDADALDEFDLYAGKFDGARVEVWEVPWDASDGSIPRRLAAGNIGAVSHGRDGFSAEVLGLGARMGQQALTQVVTAACRWRFGSPECGKDLGPLTEAAAVSGIGGPGDRRTFVASALAGSFGDGYFANGVVTWTSGDNEGVSSHVKEYDGDTGTFILWDLLPKPPTAGDGFTVTPGCTLAKEGPNGCLFWNNFVNFGGFPDVPGEDAISETPDAKV